MTARPFDLMTGLPLAVSGQSSGRRGISADKNERRLRQLEFSLSPYSDEVVRMMGYHINFSFSEMMDCSTKEQFLRVLDNKLKVAKVEFCQAIDRLSRDAREVEA